MTEPPEPTPAPVSDFDPTTAVTVKLEPVRKRRRWVLIVIVIGVLALVAVLAYVGLILLVDTDDKPGESTAVAKATVTATQLAALATPTTKPAEPPTSTPTSTPEPETDTVPPTNTPTPAPTAPPPASTNFGQQFKSGNAAIIVSEIKRHSTFDIWNAEAGDVFISVAISYAHVGTDGTVSPSPLNFRLQTDEGNLHGPMLVSLKPALGAMGLRPGAQTSGWVTFEVEASAKEFTLIWSPGLFSQDVEILLK